MSTTSIVDDITLSQGSTTNDENSIMYTSQDISLTDNLATSIISIVESSSSMADSSTQSQITETSTIGTTVDIDIGTYSDVTSDTSAATEDISSRTFSGTSNAEVFTTTYSLTSSAVTAGSSSNQARTSDDSHGVTDAATSTESSINPTTVSEISSVTNGEVTLSFSSRPDTSEFFRSSVELTAQTSDTLERSSNSIAQRGTSMPSTDTDTQETTTSVEAFSEMTSLYSESYTEIESTSATSTVSLTSLDISLTTSETGSSWTDTAVSSDDVTTSSLPSTQYSDVTGTLQITIAYSSDFTSSDAERSTSESNQTSDMSTIESSQTSDISSHTSETPLTEETGVIAQTTESYSNVSTASPAAFSSEGLETSEISEATTLSQYSSSTNSESGTSTTELIFTSQSREASGSSTEATHPTTPQVTLTTAPPISEDSQASQVSQATSEISSSTSETSPSISETSSSVSETSSFISIGSPDLSSSSQYPSSSLTGSVIGLTTEGVASITTLVTALLPTDEASTAPSGDDSEVIIIVLATLLGVFAASFAALLVYVLYTRRSKMATKGEYKMNDSISRDSSGRGTVRLASVIDEQAVSMPRYESFDPVVTEPMKVPGPTLIPGSGVADYNNVHINISDDTPGIT